MGHFYENVTATGKTVKDAENNACDAFLYENGHRHNIRDVKMIKKIRDVPPKKWAYLGNTTRINGRTERIQEQVEDLDAPKSEWLGEWEFEIHSHA